MNNPEKTLKVNVLGTLNVLKAAKEAEPYKVEGGYLNIAGLLILKPIIFNFIERTKPGRGNEIWLTDSVELMRRDGQKIYAFTFKGVRYDIGTFESLEEADRLEQERETLAQNSSPKAGSR